MDLCTCPALGTLPSANGSYRKGDLRDIDEDLGGDERSRRTGIEVAETWAWESTEIEMVLIATPAPSDAAYSDKIEKMLFYGSQP